MANDTVPMATMFLAVSLVMDRDLVPMHYGIMTEKALDFLGVRRELVNMRRQKEDVREKMLCAGRYGTLYIPSPLCLGVKTHWFKKPLLISDSESIVVPGHAQRGVKGALEALMRDPHMVQKNAHVPTLIVKIARVHGMVLEKHVTEWFGENWPEFYLPPDNEGQWKDDCSHDFKLKVDGKEWEFDVFGPDRWGTFKNPGNGKKRVDFHLACQMVGQDVLWKAIYTGKNYDGELSLATGESPKRMVVWLNCKRDGIPYEQIKQWVNRGGVR